MYNYATDYLGTHTRNNLIKLRADIHKIFSAHKFAFVPKKEIYGPQDPAHPPTYTYVIHVLARDATEAWLNFHNVPVGDMGHASAGFCLARFARAVLLGVKDFCPYGTPA